MPKLPLAEVRGPLDERLRELIAAKGSIPFDRYVDLVLYDDEHGFYSTTGRAGGRTGDFVTSVEVGPLFGAVIGRWLDRVWQVAGSPSTFSVCESGAGVGTLFRAIHRAKPACFDALTYTLVERSASMRVAHQSLPGNRWRSAVELPDEHHDVIMANELLDNVAFGIAERTETGWACVQVGVDGDGLSLQTGQARAELDHLERLAPGVPTGCRVPVAGRAHEWVSAATRRADRVLVFDYGATTAELASRPDHGWLRTYAGHHRGADPLVSPGDLDITHDVPWDQLPEPTSIVGQADWLRAEGIEELVDQARAVWRDRAHIGDLEAVIARSAIGEADALTDPTGLGAFHALEWMPS